MAAALLGSSLSAFAVTPNRFSGSIGGEVKDGTGIVQMGATVFLYNRYDRMIRQSLTDAKGSFLFDSLLPDLYSIRVSLAAFVPAFKKNITVQPGFHSVLTINLASMFSSIELVSTTLPKESLMSDDWKWVLRSSQATRPVIRFRDTDLDASRPRFGNVFSETRGIVRVSTGDAVSFAGTGTQPDLGTAFALATSLFGSSQLQVSGNVGFASHTGMPTAGFRTTYSRPGAGSNPEITVTMRQMYLPSRGGFGSLFGQDGSGAALRTMSVSMLDEITLFDTMRLEYGMSLESVSLFEKLHTLSPFARLTYDLASKGSVQLAYNSGVAPMELASRNTNGPSTRELPELHNDLTALSVLPRVSLRDGHARVQRNENVEIGYRKTAGSRTFSVGAYHERISNGALLMAGPDNLFAGDVLPDLDRIRACSIRQVQPVGLPGFGEPEPRRASGCFDRLWPRRRIDDGPAGDADRDRGRAAIHRPGGGQGRATARVSGAAPVMGTRFSASYGVGSPVSDAGPPVPDAESRG